MIHDPCLHARTVDGMPAPCSVKSSLSKTRNTTVADWAADRRDGATAQRQKKRGNWYLSGTQCRLWPTPRDGHVHVTQVFSLANWDYVPARAAQCGEGERGQERGTAGCSPCDCSTAPIHDVNSQVFRRGDCSPLITPAMSQAKALRVHLQFCCIDPTLSRVSHAACSMQHASVLF
ncbi:hypothetical protein CC85DRAFT_62504 [Cutaneotrichosporon oleaginosum]|uniref:Uncharacterized protein n=1 Tax=Cutaneotrichosporon oleaginosum TaxID=879819 RepID=A0A0J0XQE8_9TREE|nr:uncharacterized protein CC85DRAFT_62504 [Cutaneotrichosporon oleaginosum]KLT43340.1 hypothetical protein CC85DRAFT_62504 [Cutaneotrichosporon oleaginosum]TXT14398.1 hypothetical protein COLE_00591 [Cutaneotrichosporon oleaginosum]